MANPAGGGKSKEDLKRSNRKVVLFGTLKIKKKGEGKEDMKAFINITEHARKQLGLTAVSPKQTIGSRKILVTGAMANKCKVYLKPTGTGAARKQKTVTITVPSAAGVEDIAKFLIANCKAKCVGFAPNARGRSYPLGMFETAGSGAGAGGAS
jgi:hypothetical protein